MHKPLSHPQDLSPLKQREEHGTNPDSRYNMQTWGYWGNSGNGEGEEGRETDGSSQQARLWVGDFQVDRRADGREKHNAVYFGNFRK